MLRCLMQVFDKNDTAKSEKQGIVMDFREDLTNPFGGGIIRHVVRP
jgi:hypothetical protein